MAVVSLAVCPHPPLLVPEVAAGAASELDDLRAACDTALARMLGGVDGVRLVAAAAGLPSALHVGHWLLRRSGCALPVREQVLDPGAALSPPSGREGLLVMADGSARRTPKAPGAFHPQSEPFDAGLARLLRDGSAADLADADELWCTDAAAFAAIAALPAAGWVRDLLYDAAPYGVGYLVASWVHSDA